jgi:fluoroquinolone transport system permease protein
MKTKALRRIIIADAKNIHRDYSLSIMLVVPFLCLAVVRWGGALLLESFPEADKFVPPIVAMMSIMVAAFPSFMTGFVMMDEKDSNVTDVYRIVPFSLENLIILRCIIMVLIGFFNSLLLLLLNGLITLPIPHAIILSVQMALFSPFGALLMISLAENKIEAAAILKGITFILFLGVLQFFIPGNLKYLLSPVPAFWTSRAFSSIDNTGLFLLFSSVSVLIHTGYIAILFRRAIRRL